MNAHRPPKFFAPNVGPRVATSQRPTGRWHTLAMIGLLTGVLAGCASPASPVKKHDPQEKFGAMETYSRLFDAPPDQSCEAARRALLSQGYLVNATTPQWIEGKKSFQPEAEAHLEMMIRVVCVPDNPDGKISMAFATAVQDSYTLKKSNSSASLGLGAIGSVSVPISATSDGMTKVGSETITAAAFYDRFFDLVKQYLVLDTAQP